MSNVQWVNDSNLCHGCGACDAVCPHGSITMVNNGKNNFPLIDMSCTDCTLCEKACSGYQTKIDTSNIDSLHIYTAYSKIDEIRSKSSSGGFITQYLLDLLDNGKIDGAIVTTSDGSMVGTKATIATTRDDILNSIGSKYYPSSNCSILKDLDFNKKYAFVGKGCDIESLNLIKDVNKRIFNSIYVKIGLMCHHTPFAKETKKLLNKYNFKVSKNTKLTYRSEGWPGQTVIENNRKKEVLDYKISWGENLGQRVPYRCQICTQSFSPQSDIVVGDAWSENKNLDNMQDGISLIIANTELGLKEIFTMKSNGNIFLEKSNKETLIQSQEYLLNKLKKSNQNLYVLSLFNKNIKLNKDNFKVNFLDKTLLSSLKFNVKFYLKVKQ